MSSLAPLASPATKPLSDAMSKDKERKEKEKKAKAEAIQKQVQEYDDARQGVVKTQTDMPGRSQTILTSPVPQPKSEVRYNMLNSTRNAPKTGTLLTTK